MTNQRKIQFAYVKKHGVDPLYVEDAWKMIRFKDEAWRQLDLSSREAQECMESSIKEALYKLRNIPEDELESYASRLHNPKGLTDDKLRGIAYAQLSDQYAADFDKVSESLKGVLEDNLKDGRIPEGMFPGVDAREQERQSQKYAHSHQQQEAARRGALRNTEVDRRVEDYQKSCRDAGLPEPSSNDAKSHLRDYEREIIKYQEENGVSKAEAKAQVRGTDGRFQHMADGGVPYKGQCKEQWYDDELTPRGHEPQQPARQQEHEMA